jgi:hypothetical protein
MGLLDSFQVTEVSGLSNAGYCSFYCKHDFGWWGGCVQLRNQEEGGAVVSVGEIWY